MSPTQARRVKAGSTTARRGFPLERFAATAAAPRGPGAESAAALREARLSERFAEMVDCGLPVLGFVVRRPRSSMQVLLDIRTLPKLTALLPPGDEAPAVRAQMMRHQTSRRLMSGVSAALQIPAVPGSYLEGHERATVRRKIRAAVRQGVTVRSVPADERPALLALADRAEQENEREEYRTVAPQNLDLLHYRTWFGAYDDDGQPIALAVTPFAGEWATLRYFRTLRTGPAASDARYYLTQAVAEELCAHGVRHLVDTARPHWLPNGLRHFQRMVGFRLVRVGPARIDG